MKQAVIICALFVIVFSFGALAQPTLTWGCLPKVGDQYITQVCNPAGVLPGNAGTNQTWDFSGITKDSIITYNVVAANATASSASYPSATFCTTNGKDYYLYGKGNSSTYEILGSIDPYTQVTFSNTEIVLNFPFTYNSAFTDSFKGSGYAPDFFLRDEKTEATADAYGTITTPAGTFSNALRVKERITGLDDAGGGHIFYLRGTTYSWYIDGFANPIMYVSNDTSEYVFGTTHTTASASYIVNGPTGISMVKPNFSFNIFPLPTTNSLTVSTEKEITRVTISNVLGKIIMDIPCKNDSTGTTVEIPVAALPDGVYLCTVTTPQGILTKKIVKE